MDRQFSGVNLSRGNASRIAAKKSFMESHPQPRELIALHFWLSSNHDARAAMLADFDLPDFRDQGFCLRIAHPNSIQQGHSAAWLTDGLERHGQSPLAGQFALPAGPLHRLVGGRADHADPQTDRDGWQQAEQQKDRPADQPASAFVHGELPCSAHGWPVVEVYRFLAISRNRSQRALISSRLSLPNFSTSARATSKATTFSTITLAADTAQTSLRS